jgi:uracil-DNA glycosylase
MIDTQILPLCWRATLGPALAMATSQALAQFLITQESAGKKIYPPAPERLAAFALTPLATVKTVILGQDPYHGAGQAHGLAFSVRKGQRVPPSLVNIYKELQSDLGLAPVPHGDLTAWAQRGVLLLNNALTVEESRAGSHQKRGWEAHGRGAVDWRVS